MRLTIIILAAVLLSGCMSKEQAAMAVFMGFVGSKYCNNYNDGVVLLQKD